MEDIKTVDQFNEYVAKRVAEFKELYCLDLAAKCADANDVMDFFCLGERDAIDINNECIALCKRLNIKNYELPNLKGHLISVLNMKGWDPLTLRMNRNVPVYALP